MTRDIEQEARHKALALEAKMQGRIVFVSSVGGIITAYGLGAYCPSKHAVEGIAATMRDELSTTGITVQTINPGPYDTGFNDRMTTWFYRAVSLATVSQGR